jgi:hypothetical protein
MSPRAIIIHSSPFIYTSKIGLEAPGDAFYYVAQPDAGLSNEIAIPSFEISADISSNFGTTIIEEYNGGSSGLTWDVAPNVEDVNSTRPSHLYVNSVTDVERFGLRTYAPAAAFDVRTKMAYGISTFNSINNSAALIVTNSDNSNHILLTFTNQSGTTQMVVGAYTYTGGAYTERGVSSPRSNVQYLRLTRDGSNNVFFYFSSNGILWNQLATVAFTFTVAKVGYRFDTNDTSTFEFYSDWLRCS